MAPQSLTMVIMTMVDHGQIPWLTMVKYHGRPWPYTMVDHGQRLWCHLTKRGWPWSTMVDHSHMAFLLLNSTTGLSGHGFDRKRLMITAGISAGIS